MPHAAHPAPVLLRRLLDRAEVVELVGRYGRAIDGHDWGLLRSTLGRTVHVDFSRYAGRDGAGRPAADWPADGWVAWVRAFVGAAIQTEHLTANHAVAFDPHDGDRAEAQCSLAVRRHVARDGVVRDNASHAHATYAVRREAGRWVITGLRAELSWLDGDASIGGASGGGAEPTPERK